MATINWFPGHMKKTQREIKENLKLVDAIIEIRDARIPRSSANPDIDKLCGNKPRVILLNKSDLTESKVTKAWIKELSKENVTAIEVNCLKGQGLNQIKPALETLLKEIKFSVIRGNVSEIKFAGSKTSGAKGVDAAEGDKVTEENLDEMIAYAKNISEKLGSVIAMSGAIDIVADKNTAYIIRNGHSMMSDITGTGCMLSSVVGVFISANPDNILKATAVALSAYGLAGELAYKKTMEMDGYTSTLRMNLIDYMGKMNAEMFQGGAKIEVR